MIDINEIMNADLAEKFRDREWPESAALQEVNYRFSVDNGGDYVFGIIVTKETNKPLLFSIEGYAKKELLRASRETIEAKKTPIPLLLANDLPLDALNEFLNFAHCLDAAPAFLREESAFAFLMSSKLETPKEETPDPKAEEAKTDKHTKAGSTTKAVSTSVIPPIPKTTGVTTGGVAAVTNSK